MNKNMKITIAIGFIIIGFLFFWFQVRPSNIRSECAFIAKDNAIEEYTTDYPWADPGSYSSAGYKHYYDMCLQEKGLKK